MKNNSNKLTGIMLNSLYISNSVSAWPDNCKKFDPTNWHRKEKEPDPMKGMGIKMIQQIAKSVSYRHTLGLNVLSIEI